MDRLSQLRGEAGGSRDSTLDTSTLPSEAYITANEASTSKFYSLSEDESTFDISPIKDVSLASAANPEKPSAESEDLIPNLSPIPKKNDLLDSYKIGKQIDPANILSGGVDIFDDNDNSYDGDELVIDDNVVEIEEKSNPELKLPEPELPFQKADEIAENALEHETIASIDTEVVLQIDGNNVNAIAIGNGLYLYRKDGEEELAAVQIVDDDQQQPSFKFLKVRENAEGNLEVYEEIEIEVPKELPIKDDENAEKNASHVPIKDINKVINDPTCNKVAERKNKSVPNEESPALVTSETTVESLKEMQADSKPDVNLNGKMMKVNEMRKSPFIHSTPNKEGIPLTKTMVDLHLHPNRHSDNVKTIEVHTDINKQRLIDNKLHKNKDVIETDKTVDIISSEKELLYSNEKSDVLLQNIYQSAVEPEQDVINKECPKNDHNVETNNRHDECSDEQSKSSNDLELCKNNDQLEIKKNTEIDEKLELIQEPVKENYITKEPNTGDNEEEKSKLEVSTKKANVENETSSVDNISTKISEIKNVDSKVKDESNVITANDAKISNLDVTNKNDVHNTITATTTNSSTTEENDKSLDKSRVESAVEASNIKTIKESNESKSTVINTIETKQLEAVQCIKTRKTDGKLNTEIKITHPLTLKSESNVDQKPKHSVTHDVSKNIGISQKKETTSIANVLDQMLKNNTKKEEQILKINEKSSPVVEKQEVKPETLAVSKFIEPKIMKTTSSDKYETSKIEKIKPIVIKSDKLIISSMNLTHKTESKKEGKKMLSNLEENSMNNNNPTVPFGQWTEANRQDFLNKIKETKVPTISTNTKQLKQPNDLNRRDVLQKIDSQRQSSNAIKALEINSNKKMNVKNESKSFVGKIPVTQDKTVTKETKAPIKIEAIALKNIPVLNKKITKQEFTQKPLKDLPNTTFSHSTGLKTDLPSTTYCVNKSDTPKNTFTTATVTRKDLPNTKFSTSGISKIDMANTIFTSSMVNRNNLPNTVFSTCNITKKDLPNTTFSSSLPKADLPNATFSAYALSKKETLQRKEINNQDLIDKTIEGIINRALPTKGTQEDVKLPLESKPQEIPSSHNLTSIDKTQPGTLDAIEMKMNELHGIPFVERPAHELPKVVLIPDVKTYSKQDNTKAIVNKSTKMPNLLPFSNKNQQKVKDNALEDSEEELIEHEPVTGDIDLSKKTSSVPVQLIRNEPLPQVTSESTKTGVIITEKDFDKFARRNSVTYENCLTLNPHNVIQAIVEKETPVKKYSRNETLLAEAKIKSAHKQSLLQNKFHVTSKLMSVNDEHYNKNQSKFQIAYQSALTAKRQMGSPITIIEDKPVKVVFMDAHVHSEYAPSQLNAQGKELSPAKKPIIEDLSMHTTDSVDSDMLDVMGDGKSADENKSKSKHQRKQVLTPVDTPELELIEPKDLGIDVSSPKKKRKVEESKSEKSSKPLVPKKSYLLGRSAVLEDKAHVPQDLSKNIFKETVNQSKPIVSHKDAASAIDNLVKAAELLETQSEKLKATSTSLNESANSEDQNTPVKRGRGRPRKYPLSGETQDKNKAPSPQKKPRLIDAKKPKRESITEDDDTSDDEIIKENWTMGKINENIVCPICNKLFRSENVVFKHVKHCTGPSPNRSESDKSPERSRHSRDSESKSRDSKYDEMEMDKSEKLNPTTPKKRKSKELNADRDEVILIEDSPAMEIPENREPKEHESRKRTTQSKVQLNPTNLACDICGKTFRQFSYLATHKLQHKREDTKKSESDVQEDKSVFSCELCKKEFRKLHHLVQHRMIHNQSNLPSRANRKSSAEQSDSKVVKDLEVPKQSDDPSAAFRCEPCDKSFRKLHHLVEHRETHDGINRQKINAPVQTTTTVDKPAPAPPPQCDICKKSFRKLHHLIEHKEQHLETSSEKSDDKSVKSSLSTRDIIHECALCYMVFPNEHSLNKHSVICQRKKKQAAVKPPEHVEESEVLEDNNEIPNNDKAKRENLSPSGEKNNLDKSEIHKETADTTTFGKTEEVAKIKQKRRSKETESKSNEAKILTCKRESVKSDEIIAKNVDIVSDISSKIKKGEEKKEAEQEVNKVSETPKKKMPVIDKIVPSTNKRQKTVNLPIEGISAVSSDEEEVRYMLNPNFKVDTTSEGKLFMKVRAQKRNSLQIERPNSKDLVKRRTSLQHPPKIPRLKPKPIEPNVGSTDATELKDDVPLAVKFESVPSTDSDDSDVKYSFPKTVAQKTNTQESKSKESQKGKRKSILEKRKSLTSIAKRKSSGQAGNITLKHSVLAKQSSTIAPAKQIKRRTVEVDHRCDCGQLFSSAALLARHTSLAHTPPRIRRRRSPPPEIDTKPVTKSIPNKSPKITPKATDSRKPSMRNDPPKTTESRKSSVRSTSPKRNDSKKIKIQNDAMKMTDSKKSSVRNDVAKIVESRKLSVRSEAPKIKDSKKSSDAPKAAAIKKSSGRNDARKTTDSRKLSTRSDVSSNALPGRKSTSKKSAPKTPGRKPKGNKVEIVKETTVKVKTRRSVAHRGVPVPEKMRKLIEKSKL